MTSQTDARYNAFKNRIAEQLTIEALATKLLTDVRSTLCSTQPVLDQVGADAVMLSALAIRAGRQRYYRPTLMWLVDQAYAHGHVPYTNPLLRPIDSDRHIERYNPFNHYHYGVPRVDEDYSDPEPDYVRPLRFLQGDLYKWELELGSSYPDTLRLIRGESIDD
jgi:hypothetical protein